MWQPLIDSVMLILRHILRLHDLVRLYLHRNLVCYLREILDPDTFPGVDGSCTFIGLAVWFESC
jgi:hypothetical protein